MDPEVARMSGRIGGLTRAAKHDMREMTEPARRAFFAKFEAQVDPEGVLPEEERTRPAMAAMRAHMARLAYERHKARRERQAAALIDEAMELELEQADADADELNRRANHRLLRQVEQGQMPSLGWEAENLPVVKAEMEQERARAKAAR